MYYVSTETADKYQEFFNMMSQEHDLVLTIGQMDDILHEARKLIQLLDGPVDSESEREVYRRGFDDGANAAATDILSSI
jgi:hypothetical protein